MGLDMYAYTLRGDLVRDEEQVDVPVSQRGLDAVGFKNLSDDDFRKLSDVEAAKFWKERDAAYNRMKELGVCDTDFAYWRKFNHLHGWMEKLYRKKGGTQDSFNCTTVRLMPEDLDELSIVARKKALEPTAGFFFGGDEPFGNDDKDEVLQFIAQARMAINEGKAVFYDSWW